VCKISNDHLLCFFTSNHQTIKFPLVAILFYTELYFHKSSIFPVTLLQKLFRDPEISCVNVSSVSQVQAFPVLPLLIAGLYNLNIGVASLANSLSDFFKN